MKFTNKNSSIFYANSKKQKKTFLAPIPASVQQILGTVCKDIPGAFNDTTKWVYSRGIGKCDVIHQSDLERHDGRLANQIVFVFQVTKKTKLEYLNNASHKMKN